jgi:hypothetical protein
MVNVKRYKKLKKTGDLKVVVMFPKCFLTQKKYDPETGVQLDEVTQEVSIKEIDKLIKKCDTIAKEQIESKSALEALKTDITEGIQSQRRPKATEG